MFEVERADELEDSLAGALRFLFEETSGVPPLLLRDELGVLFSEPPVVGLVCLDCTDLPDLLLNEAATVDVGV